MNYRESVLRTMPKNISHFDYLSLGVLGVIGEGGEVVDLIKKFIHHDKPISKDKIIKELGDVRWYLEVLNITLEREFSLNEIYTHHTCIYKKLRLACIDIGKQIGTISLATERFFGINEIIEFDRDLILRRAIDDLFSTIRFIAIELESSMDEVEDINDKKLQERYPQGFSTEAANAPRT